MNPWRWREAMRDHGPDDRGFLLTMMMLATYMNREGLAYPSQTKLARDCRANQRTVRRHLDLARRLGWLCVENAGRGGQGWRHNAYRCQVPAELPTRAPKREDIAMSAPFDEREDMGVPKREDISSKREDMGEQNVRTQLCPPNSGSETLLKNSGSEIALGAGTLKTSFRKKPEELEAEALQRTEAMAASIRFRGKRDDECPRAYAAEVVRAMASAAAINVTTA